MSLSAPAAPAAHPEAAAAEECVKAGERSAGSSFWTPCCSTWTLPWFWFCHTSTLVPGGPLLCSSGRPVWTPPTPVPRLSEAQWGSWWFPRGAAEGLHPQRASLHQAGRPPRAGSQRSSAEVRGATPPGADLSEEVLLYSSLLPLLQVWCSSRTSSRSPGHLLASSPGISACFWAQFRGSPCPDEEASFWGVHRDPAPPRSQCRPTHDARSYLFTFTSTTLFLSNDGCRFQGWDLLSLIKSIKILHPPPQVSPSPSPRAPSPSSSTASWDSPTSSFDTAPLKTA